ncbi:hypothetical protein BS329_01645 [Amycolatopsis coloradensis]|uniref:Uncharacterized protein n=1 Tax=Amycolatopsis coloradensis TaxID=76021 RepID=A0A1R0L3Z0_9PSEU|nr:hypothetical protein [Amycolatopsis coloradensis]OLZ57401.1 hypothetical protein BS329_01645 [Amycolatopsis coloradensis]
MFGKVMVPAFVLAAGAMVPMALSASADTHSVQDCVFHAAYEGTADPDIAVDACRQDSLLDCYRIFREEYGRQQWALEACKLRD